MNNATKGARAKTETCSNCGQVLSKGNIRLAREEAGVPPGGLQSYAPGYLLAARAAAGLPPDELEFFCPGFDSDSETCVAYGKRDETAAARWRTTGEHLT